MSYKKLLFYAVVGIIGGLLLENKTMKVSNNAGKAARKVKRKAATVSRRVKQLL